MDGWNTTFLLRRPIFRGYVSFREGNPLFKYVASPLNREKKKRINQLTNPVTITSMVVNISKLRIISGQIIATYSRRLVTPNGGALVRESFQNPLNSGLGIIVICPYIYIYIIYS